MAGSYRIEVLPAAAKVLRKLDPPVARRLRPVIMAAFAELERDMIHQRTMAGLAAARTQGRVGGRPIVLDLDKLAAAQVRLGRGETPTKVAKALKISRGTLYRHIDVAAARTGR